MAAGSFSIAMGIYWNRTYYVAGVTVAFRNEEQSALAEAGNGG